MNLLISVLLLSLTGEQPGSQTVQANAPAKARLATEAEPGEKLVVSGRVLGPDGSPLSGASLYVYQTDKDGLYSRPVNSSSTPRLRAHLRTDSEGRYEYLTIRPGSYPDTRNPAHIHYQVKAAGFKEKVFEIVFEDDPLVDERIRASATRADSIYSIRALTRDGQGAWHCRQDVQLNR